jgi:hypothetical protein
VGECEGEEGRGFMNVGEGTSDYYIWADYSTKFFHVSIIFIFILNWAGFSSLLPRKFVAIATIIAYLKKHLLTHVACND